MLEKIDLWINQVLSEYSEEAISCRVLEKAFQGFYSPETLDNSYFVVTDEIPKPNFPEFHEKGLSGFLEKDLEGITYKNLYFIKKGYENDLSLHFHELVHVQQWKFLGDHGFINRYIQELRTYEYDEAPLEKMAYTLQEYFEAEEPQMDIAKYVQRKL
ncbi:hypothetical protein [Litoribrevibacter albus]|uniref:DUF4157 domain-containing protein n=1 Tax=Litoribrevibacter albus TaxID=1473156 RepID=A0AA37WA73_9GAMM|nr:hypothetical protein [Litoribrevibacter albus]GLQ33311.1 hypothetical protein GCM10007876_37910 [Litoribrevibacter albus]